MKRSGRFCIKCGGSWTRPYEPACAHEMGPPEPIVVSWPLARDGKVEIGFLACAINIDGEPVEHAQEVEHPTREGAIAAWQAAWRERWEAKRREADELAARRGADTTAELVTFYKSRALGPSTFATLSYADELAARGLPVVLDWASASACLLRRLPYNYQKDANGVTVGMYEGDTRIATIDSNDRITWDLDAVRRLDVRMEAQS